MDNEFTLLPIWVSLLYIIIFFACFEKLTTKTPQNKLHTQLDQLMGTSLNFVGISLAILSILMSTKQDSTNLNVKTSYFHLVFSVGFFIISYTLLHLRLKNVFVYFAVVSKNLGLFSLISGFMFLLINVNNAWIILLVVLILFFIYMITDLVILINYYQ